MLDLSQIKPNIIDITYGLRAKTDECLRKTLLLRNNADSYEKFAQRVAVFSDTMNTLKASEIRVKSMVWDYLENLVFHSASDDSNRSETQYDPVPVRTLFTSFIDGADLAAAEFFVNNLDDTKLNIAFCPEYGFSPENPFSMNFYNLSFIQNVGYKKNISPSGNAYPSGKFIIDQCFNLLFIMALSDNDDNSRINQLYDYAVSSHDKSLPHNITVYFIDSPEIKEEERLKHNEDDQLKIFSTETQEIRQLSLFG